MADRPESEHGDRCSVPADSLERIAFVMPQHMPQQPTEIDLRELWRTLWAGRWLIIGLTTLITLAFASYALFATEWYRAQVLLAPVEERGT